MRLSTMWIIRLANNGIPGLISLFVRILPFFITLHQQLVSTFGNMRPHHGTPMMSLGCLFASVIIQNCPHLVIEGTQKDSMPALMHA